MQLSANNPAPNPSAPQPKQKKKIQRTTLKPQHLMSSKGVKALYQKAKEIKFLEGKSNAIKNLTQATSVLRTWHYSLMPKYSLNLFLDRCQSFGQNKTIQFFMGRARKVHGGTEKWFDQDRNKNSNEAHRKQMVNEEVNQEDIGLGGDYFEMEIENGDRNSRKEDGGRSENRREDQQEKKRESKKMIITKLEDSDDEDEELAQLINRNNLFSADQQVEEEQQQSQPQKQEPLVDYMPSDFDDDYE